MHQRIPKHSNEKLEDWEDQAVLTKILETVLDYIRKEVSHSAAYGTE